jgi:cytochrome c553
MRMTKVAAAIAAIAMLAPQSGPPAARAAGAEEKAALCSACHGTEGRPADPSIPVLWGQNEGYIYLQLRDFKLGNRNSPVMGPVAASLEKQDMKDLAAYFAAKPWPRLDQPAAPADVAQHAEAIANSAGCKGCHLAAWQGDSVTPRVGGQGLSYLRTTMTQFRDGERKNNPWMVALLKTYSEADIAAMASYLAGQ